MHPKGETGLSRKALGPSSGGSKDGRGLALPRRTDRQLLVAAPHPLTALGLTSIRQDILAAPPLGGGLVPPRRVWVSPLSRTERARPHLSPLTLISGPCIELRSLLTVANSLSVSLSPSRPLPGSTSWAGPPQKPVSGCFWVTQAKTPIFNSHPWLFTHSDAQASVRKAHFVAFVWGAGGTPGFPAECPPVRITITSPMLFLPSPP